MNIGETVVCIDNINQHYLVNNNKMPYDLTINKHYTIIDENTSTIRIVNDNGDKGTYHKEKFISLKTNRDIILDKLLK
jgi:hypothetical protein